MPPEARADRDQPSLIISRHANFPHFPGHYSLIQIDIIIPVYRGVVETRACIESVLASKNTHPVEIVIVDDASPEPAIAEYLTSLADAGRITLLHNESNRGFVASVNSGMSLHGDRDVILLNSDTEVADGWIDRLAALASTRKDAASISPFSNNATLCSYPRIDCADRKSVV